MAKDPMLKPRHRLSQKQIRFIREYAIHGNGAEAVRKAGYKQGSAVYTQATENMRKPAIIAGVKAESARLGLNITPDRVQRRLDELSHASQEAGQFGPAVRCEELLGKSIGMWIDQSLQLQGVLSDSHVSALIELAKKRQAEPIELEDTHTDTHSDRDDG